MTRKPRTLTGFALLFALVFYAFSFAGSCGVIGRGLSHITVALVGAAGSVMIALVLAGLGVYCLAPILYTPAQQRRAARRLVRGALDHVLLREPIEVLPPPQRMRLDDLRSVLKNFGYRANEIEPVVAKMDPGQPLEVLARTALQALQKGGN